jgi:hypothetical protein
VKSGLASGDKLLLYANRARTNPDTVTPFRLWQLANREFLNDARARALAFGHAMRHAGYIKDPDGNPYRVCPDCGEALK